MVIKSGKPTIITAGSLALGLLIAETTPNSIAATNVVSNILAQFNDGGIIVIDPGEGKITASSVALKVGPIRTSVQQGDNLLLQPDAGQAGRSLMFSASAGNTLAGIDISDLTTAVKPKFTVESLVARLLSKIQEREALVPADANKFFVVVDQVNKRVGICKNEDEAGVVRDELAVIATAPAANTETISLTLTPEAEEASSSPLPFEGGAV